MEIAASLKLSPIVESVNRAGSRPPARVPLGGGGPAAERGEFTLSGRIPINPSGGLESKGHPLGATGLGQLFELSRSSAAKPERARCPVHVMQSRKTAEACRAWRRQPSRSTSWRNDVRVGEDVAALTPHSPGRAQFEASGSSSYRFAHVRCSDG